MVLSGRALDKFERRDAEGRMPLLRGGVFHRGLQQARRGASHAVCVRVYARERRSRERAEKRVVVHAEYRRLARDVYSDVVRDLEELEGAQIVRAEDGDGEGERAEPARKRARVLRTLRRLVEDDRVVRRLLYVVRLARLSRLREARGECVAPHVRIGGAGKSAVCEGRVSLREEVLRRHSSDSDMVRLHPHEARPLEVAEDIDDRHAAAGERAAGARVCNARDDSVVCVERAWIGDVCGRQEPQQPVAAFLPVSRDAADESASVFARVFDYERNPFHVGFLSVQSCIADIIPFPSAAALTRGLVLL